MSEIVSLVSDLPEIYQVIYGHPELSERVSRPCHDRLVKVTQVHDALQHLLGRPLNVLDLGCGQGFFSLNLAERGAKVHGVDFLDKNIAVCKALAQEHPQLEVSFEINRVEEVVAGLEPDQYDLILGLSIFHHLVYEKGADEVKGLLERAATRSGALIVELALHAEPLYWGPAQPQDPRALLEPIAFVHEIAWHQTHLSSIPRPLYVVSNRYWVFAGQAGGFDTWSTDPHMLACGYHEGSRRYFFNKETVVKLYRFDHSRGEYNKVEFLQEKLLLANPPPGFPVPVCYLSGENTSEGWNVVERLPGRLLLNLLRDGAAVDHRGVLLSVLDQLAALEAVGLYHGDVRTWNILVTDDGSVALIDYGSISSKKQDFGWPGNLFLSFFILVCEVVTGRVDTPNPLRTIAISPYVMPQPYCTWAKSLWQRPLADWSFRHLHDTLLQLPVNAGEDPTLQPFEAWMKATEEAIQAEKLSNKAVQHHLDARIQQTEAKAQQALDNVLALAREAVEKSDALLIRQQQQTQAIQEQLQALREEFRGLQEQLQASREECRGLQEQLQASREECGGVQGQLQISREECRKGQEQLQALYASRSWRLTAPLRCLTSNLRPLPLALSAQARRGARYLLLLVLRRTEKHPALANFLRATVSHFPRLEAHLRCFVAHRLRPGPTAVPAPDTPNDNKGIALTAAARRVYADLQAAVKKSTSERNP